MLGLGLRGLSSLDVEDEEESQSESLEVELVLLDWFFFASGFFLGCVLDSSFRTASAAGSGSAEGSVLNSLFRTGTAAGSGSAAWHALPSEMLVH